VPNALAPRKRPRTTLSPSLAFWDGTPWLAFGTPGGDQQDQWSLLLLLRMAHHGMTLQQRSPRRRFTPPTSPARLRRGGTHRVGWWRTAWAVGWWPSLGGAGTG
jgi:gamma-glutamyltranspeptidase